VIPFEKKTAADMTTMAELTSQDMLSAKTESSTAKRKSFFF